MQKRIVLKITIIICLLVVGLGGFFVWRAYQIKRERLAREAEEKVARVDTDQDGLTDEKEAELGTDPNNPDTDGDGYNDKLEIDTGHDPLVAAKKPIIVGAWRAKEAWPKEEGIEDHFFETKDYQFHFQTNYKIHDWDQKLIKKNKHTGEETIVTSSIKKTLPELKDCFNLLLRHFASPKDTNLVIFKSVLVDTGDISGSLYSFDPEKNKFNKMKVNEIYDGFYGGFALSPDQTRFIWVPNEDERGKTQIMYLIDLIQDSYKPVVHLSGNETFNAGSYAKAVHFEIRWINNNKVRYAVFDQSKKKEFWNPPTDEEIKSILIDYRELDL